MTDAAPEPSTIRRSGEPGCSRWSWPTTSSRVAGRILTASGADAPTGPPAATLDSPGTSNRPSDTLSAYHVAMTRRPGRHEPEAAVTNLRPQSRTRGRSHEVDQLFDAADERRLEIVPIPHPAPDPLPRSGDVGLLGVRPAKGPAHTTLPGLAARNQRPRRDAQPAWRDRLPDVDERMADDQRVHAAGATADGLLDPAGDASLLRAGHEVVDEDAEPTPRAGLEFLDDADEIVDAAEVFDHHALHA